MKTLTDALRETLAQFDGSGAGVPKTTTEVADALEVGRRSTYERLERLVDRGHLETKKVGARARVWWRPVGPADDGPLEPGMSVSASPEAGAAPDERSRRQYEALVTAIPDAVYLIEPDGTIEFVNYDALESLSGYTRADLEGRPFTSLLDAEDIVRTRDGVREILTSSTDTETVTQELSVHGRHGEEISCENHMAVITGPDGELEAVVGTIRDMTEWKRREQELEEFERIVETVDDGVYVLDEAGRFRRVNAAFASMTGVDRSELVGTHGSTVFGDRFDDLDEAARRGVEAGDAAVVSFEDEIRPPREDPIDVESRATGFVLEGGRGRVGIVRDITDRLERERELESQRERLAALDDLNAVARDLSAAVIEQSTRSEIERVVCEGLAATDSYEFAWIGEVDGQSGTLELRTEAGVEGYFDGRTITVDRDDPERVGPVSRVVHTHEPQVIEDILEDESHERWREYAHEWAYQSAAVIPIVHEGVLHGVLGVYADRPYAFSGGEDAVLGHLGEVVGHAIAAVEQRRALTSDEVVELEFGVADVDHVLGRSGPPDGRLVFERAVPIGDGEYLQYGTATKDMLDVLDAIVEDVPHTDSVHLLDGESTADPVRFELRLADPPIVSTLTSMGGYVDRTVLEGGSLTLRIHLAPRADVRSVLNVIREEFPMARLTTQRHLIRDPDSRVPRSRRLAESLTDRQRAALESAYYSGYYEWPRTVTGEGVASSLGVTPPTFHQHLRTAERKLVESALEDSAPM